MIIGVDFDGTMVEHLYPDIGPPVPFAVLNLQGAIAQGARIVLWTMRSGEELRAAVKWMNDHGIQLFGVNRNPEQDSWTNSPKAYCHIYIDDAALGCPLEESMRTERPRVNWTLVGPMLMQAMKDWRNHGKL